MTTGVLITLIICGTAALLTTAGIILYTKFFKKASEAAGKILDKTLNSMFDDED